MTAGDWDDQATMGDPESYITAAKIPALSAAVLKACDAQDGVSDGLINNPKECRFDPAAMLCKEADSDSCLTAPQVAALKKLYAVPSNPNREKIFPIRAPDGKKATDASASCVLGTDP